MQLVNQPFCTPANEPSWDDLPVVLLGSGPSVDGVALERLRGRAHVVAIKEACRLVDFHEATVSMDLNWPQRPHAWDLMCREASAKKLWLVVPPDRPNRVGRVCPGAFYLRRSHERGGLSEDPCVIHSGFCSGYSGLGFAYHRRPRVIFLFGYDYTTDLKPGGKHHAGSLNPWFSRGQAAGWGDWANHFATAVPQLEAAGIRVVNANPGSAITCFPKVTSEEALESICRF